MNISTGGPHILLFERDQQLAPLLLSELQLAGYECHVARTAVEVFDAIARYPIRLVLVNLAQAAASRREFWVALDTQRRGRGVQVLTFQCTNLAGYGPQMPDDRTPAMADMQVDGMLGLMSLVEAVRTRVPGQTTTSTMPRTSRVGSAPLPAATDNNLATAPTLHGTSGSFALPRTSVTGESRSIRSGSAGAAHATSTGIPPVSASAPVTPSTSVPAAPLVTVLPQVQSQPEVLSPTLPPVASESTHTGQSQQGYQNQSFTEKIHAVLYPTPRSRQPQNTVPTIDTERPVYEPPAPVPVVPNPPVVQSPPSSELTALQRLAGQESSLAQLSRLVQESRPSIPPAAPAQVYTEHSTPENRHSTATEQSSVQLLRVSPIQDLPMPRSEYASNGQVSSEDARPVASVTPLASIAGASSVPPVSLPETTDKPVEAADGQLKPVTPASPSSPAPAPLAPHEPEIEEVEDSDLTYEQVELATPLTRSMRTSTQTDISESAAENNALLLDIVQSLPPMPTPPPQPQVLHGRATRPLGSVLLEGHLVPQSRLEVAQGIQRMLRGVDLNYQLGEILLMFKLLTPDQLLAASLVSYGLITTQQIASLGRIRQELHSIGLEYDLENLLILFRILTAEQLREVRSSWQ